MPAVWNDWPEELGLLRSIRVSVPRYNGETVGVRLDDTDRARAELLADRARNGVLSHEEETELESYRHVARLLELMKSKARRSLQPPGEAA